MSNTDGTVVTSLSGTLVMEHDHYGAFEIEVSIRAVPQIYGEDGELIPDRLDHTRTLTQREIIDAMRQSADALEATLD